MFVKDGRKIEVPFIFDGNGGYNVFLELHRLYWFTKEDLSDRTPMTLADRDLIAERIDLYCKRRDFAYRIMG